MTDLALLIFASLLLCVVGVQSYFLYKLSQTVSVLRAAPDAESARILLRAGRQTPVVKEPPKPKPEVSPADLGPEAIAALRKKQDEHN